MKGCANCVISYFGSNALPIPSMEANARKMNVKVDGKRKTCSLVRACKTQTAATMSTQSGNVPCKLGRTTAVLCHTEPDTDWNQTPLSWQEGLLCVSPHLYCPLCACLRACVYVCAYAHIPECAACTIHRGSCLLTTLSSVQDLKRRLYYWQWRPMHSGKEANIFSSDVSPAPICL